MAENVTECSKLGLSQLSRGQHTEDFALLMKGYMMIKGLA